MTCPKNNRDDNQSMCQSNGTHLFDIWIITGGKILIDSSETDD